MKEMSNIRENKLRMTINLAANEGRVNMQRSLLSWVHLKGAGLPAAQEGGFPAARRFVVAVHHALAAQSSFVKPEAETAAPIHTSAEVADAVRFVAPAVRTLARQAIAAGDLAASIHLQLEVTPVYQAPPVRVRIVYINARAQSPIAVG
jgi:hypothetical protein